MPSYSDTNDDLYLSTKQNIINFSDNWRSLYHPFSWPKVIQREEVVRTDNINNTNKENMPECEKHHSYIPYGEYFIANNFIPNNHSTPNKITRRESISSCTNSGTVDEMSFSTTYPDASLSADRCRNSSSEDRIESTSQDSVNPIPSISRDIDSASRNKYTCQDVCCDRSPKRRVRRTGIKGVRCIVSFALTDNRVRKQTQIRACSISVMFLAIIIISITLVYFISTKYSVKYVPMPTISSNSSEHRVTGNSTAILPALRMQHLTHLTSTLPPISTTPIQYVNDAPVQERNTNVSKIIQMIQKNLKSFPKFPRSKITNVTEVNEPVTNMTAAKEEEYEDVCNKCQKDVQVCMLNEESGIPICMQAVDRHDPTGCGGRCALDTEACQLVDRTRGVRVCRAISLRCSALQWRCYNGLCVPGGGRCDGTVDCYDRSDEMHCECDLSKNFRCGHSTSCFSNSKLCDGNVDCWDGFDEANCTNNCQDNEFTCNDGQCITSARFCDGLADCMDGSDEPSGCDEGCAVDQVQCANKRCVPRSARCDGIDNCGDRTDEMHCS